MKTKPPSPAPSLAQLQRWLRHAITSEESVFPADLRDCSASVADQPPLSRAERIEVYSYAWFARLEESLHEDFELVASWLDGADSGGGSAFSELCLDYLTEHSSRSHTLLDAGRRLPEFIATWSHPRATPWLADLARLELARVLSHHAADTVALDPSILTGLAGVDPGSLVVSTQPAVTLLECAWAVQEVSAPVQPPREGRTFLAVLRPRFDVETRVLDAPTFAALSAASRAGGMRLLDFVAHLETLPGGEALATQLGQWALQGLIRIQLANPMHKDSPSI